MKTYVNKLDATPSKRIFLSIISDYDLEQAICELIDNTLDNWLKNGKKHRLDIKIDLNIDQQTISVQDNSGGIPKEDLKFVVGPGQSGNSPSDLVIGIFGVGTKRAVVALAQEVRIASRYKLKETYMVEFDDNWLQDADWGLPYYRVDEIAPSSTKIFLQRLRNKFGETQIKKLEQHLGATYSKFLSDKQIRMMLNSSLIKSENFEKWAFPPKYLPRNYLGKLHAKDGKQIDVSMRAGLSTESSPAEGEYGVYFYCNNRLVARAVKDFHVGFAKGLAGLPHPNISLMRVIVSMSGPAELMPWNSSKSGIYYNHATFVSLREALVPIVTQYAAISRALQGDWPNEVFRYRKGKIKTTEEVDLPHINTAHFPPIPRSRYSYADKIAGANKKIVVNKPWTRGLVGGVIASEMLSKKSIDEKNRIALIVLDSTLEIAFKEYLVNESKTHYSDSQLVSLFKQRHLVDQEVQKYIKFDSNNVRKIKYYYNLRCKLVHERASVGITDEQIEDYDAIVKKILKKMFGLEF